VVHVTDHEEVSNTTRLPALFALNFFNGTPFLFSSPPTGPGAMAQFLHLYFILSQAYRYLTIHGFLLKASSSTIHFLPLCIYTGYRRLRPRVYSPLRSITKAQTAREADTIVTYYRILIVANLYLETA